MNIVFSVLSIMWGLFILIIFFSKLKDQDFKAYKAKQDVDEGLPYLVAANWILRKTPTIFIKGIVIAMGLVFIVGGLAGLVANHRI